MRALINPGGEKVKPPAAKRLLAGSKLAPGCWAESPPPGVPLASRTPLEGAEGKVGVRFHTKKKTISYCRKYGMTEFRAV